jgi:hypothetical protein
MGLRPCHECHQFVSEKARTCPRCGVPDPVVSDEDTGWVGRYRGALMLALMLLVAEVAWFRAQVRELSGPPPVPPVAVRPDSFPGYESLTGVRLNAQLYDREHRAYVGRIVSLNCPDPTPWQHSWRCIEIEFADGRREWVQHQVAAQSYLAAVSP